MKAFTKKDWILLSLSASIALGGVIYNQYLQQSDPAFHPQPLTQDEIKTLSNNDTSAIVIYPIFTQYAYMKNGFYDYYSGKCHTCTTVSMKPFGLNPNYNTDKNGFDILVKLNYQFITDITVDKHPEILKDYGEVILLHNEYMTQDFEAIKERMLSYWRWYRKGKDLKSKTSDYMMNRIVEDNGKKIESLEEYNTRQQAYYDKEIKPLQSPEAKRLEIIFKEVKA